MRLGLISKKGLIFLRCLPAKAAEMAKLEGSKMKSAIIKPGANIICGVAPGWIFAGHVTEVSEDSYILSPALWLENVSHPWPEAAKDRKKIKTSSAIDKHEAFFHATLWASYATEAVVGKAAIDAIEGVK